MLLLVTLVLSLALAFFGGVFYERGAKVVPDEDDTQKMIRVADSLLDLERLRNTHRMLSSRASLSGTENDYRLATVLRDEWLNAGLDDVRIVSYDVYISYPNRTNFSYIAALANDGSALYSTDFRERCCYSKQEQYEEEVDPPYMPYARSGTVEGDLVYGNLCRESDIERLLKLRVRLQSAIVLCRVPRLAKCPYNDLMMRENISAVLCFRDPRNVAPEGMSADKVYPNTMWMPPDASFRYPLTSRGDATSKNNVPSLPYFPRDEVDSHRPTVIMQLLGYGYALKLLSFTNLSVIPDDWWTPEATNANYSIIPEQSSKLAARFRLSINIISEVKPIHNVLGFLNGYEEPDRYVMFGNHKDSFHYGATDSKGSTSILTELARLFGQLLRKKNWRPRRTVVFAAWSGEEAGLIGSNEFVEHFYPLLAHRAIVYVNTDMAVTGNLKFVAGGSPLTEDLVHELAKSIRNPNYAADGGATLFDSWLLNDPDTSQNPPKAPRYSYRLPLSDYMTFHLAGIPFFEGMFRSSNVGAETYHTGYDTFYYVTKFIDPTYEMHFAICRFYAAALLRLSNDIILPFTLQPYATVLLKAFDELLPLISQTSTMSDAVRDAHREGLQRLQSALNDFQSSAQLLDDLGSRMKSNPGSFTAVERRSVNEKLTFVERHFAESKDIQRIVLGISSDSLNGFEKIYKSLTADEKTVRMAYAKTVHALRSAITYIRNEHFYSNST